MSLAALSGFAQGLGAGANARKSRLEREEADARQDRLISALEGGIGVPPGPKGQSGGAVGGAGKPGAYMPIPDGPVTLDSLLYKHEGAGNADTLFAHSQNGGAFDGVRVSEMTIDEASEFSRPDGEYGQWVKRKLGEMGHTPRVATPMGYGQIVGTTLRNTAKAMGLPGDTKFDRETQSKMVNYLAGQRLQGASSPAAKRAALRAEWEGFKHVPNHTLDAAIANFEQGGGTYAARGMGLKPV